MSWMKAMQNCSMVKQQVFMHIMIYLFFFFLLILDAKCEVDCVLDSFSLRVRERCCGIIALFLPTASVPWPERDVTLLSCCQAPCVWSGRRAPLLPLYGHNEDFHCSLNADARLSQSLAQPSHSTETKCWLCYSRKAFDVLFWNLI